MLFRFLGTTWAATPYAWLNPIFWCVLGFAVGFLGHEGAEAAAVWVTGIAYGMMLCAVDFLHSVGHVLAGRLVGSPMAVNLVTATRDVAVYARPGSSASRRERLGRALGGPALNLLCGILALPLGHIIGGDWLGMFGLFNLCIGVWTLLPIPTLDGAVIWGALLGTERD